MCMFNLNKFLIKLSMLISCQNFMILDLIDSFRTLESSTIKNSQLGSHHSLKIHPNPNKTLRNPSFDQCNFKLKFLPIPKTKIPK